MTVGILIFIILAFSVCIAIIRKRMKRILASMSHRFSHGSQEVDSPDSPPPVELAVIQSYKSHGEYSKAR